jgi:hypothetical protein
VIDSITFNIPGDPNSEHNQRGHTIVVSLEGVGVECGYVNDDRKWEAWKGRQAADWLTEFEREFNNPTFEDYEYQPNQDEVR